MQVIERLSWAIRQGSRIIIPPTTYYEIRRGFKHKTSPGKEFAFSLICKSYEIGEMNLVAWEKAADIYAEIRKNGKPIEDTDILYIDSSFLHREQLHACHKQCKAF